MAGGRSYGRAKPESLGPVMHSLLARLGYQKRSSALFAMTVWRHAVGEAVARHAVPERVERDVLHVVVDGAAWANELRWMEGTLVSQLNAACGRPVVSRLRFRIGTLPSPLDAKAAERGVAPPPRPPTAEARLRADRLAGDVSDPELAEAWRRLVRRGLMRQSGTMEGEVGS